jgi:hypothetical protein
MTKFLNYLREHGRAMGLFAIIAGAAFFLLPDPAQAAWFDFGSYLIGKVVFVVSYIISQLGGWIIAFEAWIIGVLLDLSTKVLISPVVIYGYPVVLAIANLGFLIGIIIIGIMTILRQESYGVKQALWRLAVMAILINFGLVLAGSVLDFSNSISRYFLSAVDPGAQGGQYNAFASSLAGAFNPQKGPLSGPNVVQNSTPGEATIDESSLTGMLKPITSLIFVIFALIGIIISLGTLIVMLVYRYVKLTFLLVTLPLQWAAWVFPDTRKYFSNWWSDFLKQCFFVPIVLFFLWLVIITGAEMSRGSTSFLSFATQNQGSDTAYGAIAVYLGVAFAGVLAQALQAIVMVGLIMGGMSAASALNIQFASQAQKAFGGVVDSGKSWAKGRSRQIGTNAVRIAGGEKLGTKLQTRGFGRLLNKIPLAETGASYLGAGLQRVTRARVDDQLADAGKRLGSMNDQQLANSFNRLTPYEQIAAMERLHKTGSTKLMDPQMLARYASKDQEALYARYGKGKLLSEVRDQNGLEFLRLQRDIADSKKTDKERMDARAELEKHLRSSANVGKYAEMLFSLPKNKDGSVKEEALPIGANLSEINGMREALIASALTGNLGGGQIGTILQQVTRGDSEQDLKAVIGKVFDKNKDLKVNEKVYNTIDSGPVKALGISAETLGLPPRPDKAEPPKRQAGFAPPAKTT